MKGVNTSYPINKPEKKKREISVYIQKCKPPYPLKILS